jgi:hypothetical protein
LVIGQILDNVIVDWPGMEDRPAEDFLEMQLRQRISHGQLEEMHNNAAESRST